MSHKWTSLASCHEMRKKHECPLFHSRCNTLQHTATHVTHVNKWRLMSWEVYNTLVSSLYFSLLHTASHCNTLQHIATHCSTRNTLQHIATHCSTRHAHRRVMTRVMQRAKGTRILCFILAATQCNTYRRVTTRVRRTKDSRILSLILAAPHCNTLQHIAQHCNTCHTYSRVMRHAELSRCAL